MTEHEHITDSRSICTICKKMVLQANAGPQAQFITNEADICIFGGSAGGGKSFGLMLLAVAAAASNSNFRGVMFRRETKQITGPNGLWDKASSILPHAGCKPKLSTLEWLFKNGARLTFSHMEHESDKEKWQGLELTLAAFDELTHFTESQFWYIWTRLRSSEGTPTKIRASTNPANHHWVKRLLAPWVDRNFPQPAASNETRYMRRNGDEYEWWDENGNLYTKNSPHVISVCFIRASLYDNVKLMKADPHYETKLLNAPEKERQELLYGDWDYEPGNKMFSRKWFPIKPQAECPSPADLEKDFDLVRYWDLAASVVTNRNKDPDFTAGVLLGKRKSDGSLWILDVEHARGTPGDIKRLVQQTAAKDGKHVRIFMEEEGGSSGKNNTADYTQALMGYVFRGIRSTGSKAERARPVSSYAETVNIYVREAAWNTAFLNELCAFPLGSHDDMVDALSGAFNQLAAKRQAWFR